MHCPTDIVVKDEDSKIVLTISDNVIQLNDELIYAFVYENEKIFYLPTNIDYTIEILATDDGVMDYEVSTITPGGAERVVAYDDVKLEKDEVFTSLVTSEVYQSVDTYNLVSNSGEIVEADCDTLPPVSSDVTDVVIAEELFSDFSKDSINALADAMFSMKSSVSLSEYKIALNDSVALFSAVSKYYPVEYSLMANGDFSYRIVYSKANNYITEIRFDYGEAADLSRYQEKVAAVKTEIDALVDVIKGMSDFEKALYIHDYIVLNCQYDTELLKVLETDGKLSGELVSERYSEYSVLVNGTGICGSYALAYRAILNAAGVECVYVSSTEMNHAWNMVKIDGEWYHVDCCWDDPVPDSEGIARRTHFLRTDKEMMDLSHYSWSPGQYKATSEKYSDMPRNYDYVQKYDYTNDDWYYLLGNTIYKANKYGNNKTTFAKNIKADSIDCNNGRVFYSDDLFVYEYSDTEETWEPVYYVSKYDVGYDPKVAYIVNFFVDENNISYYKYTKEDYYNSKDDYGIISTVTYVKDELKREVFESITGIEIDYTELEMAVFDYEYIYSTIITDYDVWDLDVEYSSSDENIVSVDEYGTIIALNAGEAVITASFMEHSATCVVKVIGGDSSAGSCGTNIKWIYDAETGKLSLNGSGAMTNYTSGKTPWNSFVAEIKSVEISDGITSIGNFAFYNGKNITSVTIPETVTSIGRYSFNNCGKVEKLDIPSKVTSIGDSAFAFCYALSDVEIPSGVNKLGSSVFEYCESLRKIEIPTAINYIDTYMFCGCESLEEVTFGSNIEHIRDYAFMYCSSLTSIYLPSSVTTISRYAFADCTALKEIMLSDNITILSDNVFNGCTSLESITIPEGVTELYGSTFEDCTSLKEVKLPSGLETIDYAEFQNCTSLESITIPAAVTSIYDNSFSDCFSLKEINVEENNQYYSSVDGVLFNKDKTTLIQVPAGIEISSYSVPQSVTVIEDNAFRCCGKLKSITIPESVTDIGSLAFSECTNLENVNIPDNITSIESGLFQLCENLKSLTIPDGITKIKSFAFNGCDSLTHVGYECSESEFGNIKIDKSANSALLNAPYIHYDFDFETDVVVMDEKAPTCTQEGNTAGVYCKDCKLFLSGEAISKTDHNYEVSESFEGSCTETPYDVYTCIDCKESYTSYAKSSAGHKKETTVVKATCTQPGFTLETCTACGESTTVDFTLPIGHRLYIVKPADYCENHGTYQYRCMNKACDYSEHITIDASELETVTVVTESTCTESGTKKEVCNLCNATMTTEYSAPKGHTFSDEWTVDKEATETELGSKSRYCINCDAKTDITEIIYQGCSHKNTTVINESEPSCEADGYTGDVVCECGETLKKGEVIPATGHTEVVDEAVSPDCENEGLTEGKHCSVCNKVLAKQEPINKLGHTEVVDKGYDPSCTENGLTDGSHCSTCKEVLVKQEPITKLGHTEVVDKGYDPTCTENGLSDGSHCSTCKEVLVKQEPIAKLGHTEVVDKGYDPTCTENGLSDGSHCSTCNEVLIKQEEIPLKGHSLGDAADCTHAQTCLECGAELEAALGHDYIDFVTEPNCEDKGFTTHTCSRCGDSFIDSYIDALGHTEVVDKGYEATHESTGLTDGSHCSECGKIILEQEIIPVLHLVGDVDKDGKVSIMDATIIQRHIAQLTSISEERIVCADTDKDGKISIMDATMIQRFIAQLISQL